MAAASAPAKKASNSRRKRASLAGLREPALWPSAAVE
jgi:hypothetical protein